jgi:hypothetical protein
MSDQARPWVPWLLFQLCFVRNSPDTQQHYLELPLPRMHHLLHGCVAVTPADWTVIQPPQQLPRGGCTDVAASMQCLCAYAQQCHTNGF